MQMNLKGIFVSLVIIFDVASMSSQRQEEKKDLFKHASDHKFDVSNFLSSTAGFLPIPIIITEPAVGYGGGAVLTYFHKKKIGDKRPLGLSPTITFGGGAYTQNGTWAGFLGHQGSYNKDKIRYLGFAGYVSPNLSFYGPGLGDIAEKEYVFNMEGFCYSYKNFYSKSQRKTPLFVGFNYLYFQQQYQL